MSRPDGAPYSLDMADTASITLVKRMTYRDAQEEWSNTYHFTGTTPADDAAWRALALAIHSTEKTLYVADVVLVTAYGYAPGDEHSVAQIDFTTGSGALPPGTYLPGGTAYKWSGDQAGWIRAKIGVSSTGKKVYIRKYFHGGSSEPADPDELADGLKTRYTAHAAACLGGGWPGGATWSGPQGQTGTVPTISRYTTTRTLKRRGKRP